MLPRVLRSYQKKKEGSEIVNRWHAANKKSDEKAKKAKSQEKPPTSSDSRSSGFSTPHTDTVHNKVLAADGLPDLEDAPLEFPYGKDLLPSWIHHSSGRSPRDRRHAIFFLAFPVVG